MLTTAGVQSAAVKHHLTLHNIKSSTMLPIEPPPRHYHSFLLGLSELASPFFAWHHVKDMAIN